MSALLYPELDEIPKDEWPEVFANEGMPWGIDDITYLVSWYPKQNILELAYGLSRYPVSLDCTLMDLRILAKREDITVSEYVKRHAYEFHANQPEKEFFKRGTGLLNILRSIENTKLELEIAKRQFAEAREEHIDTASYKVTWLEHQLNALYAEAKKGVKTG